MYVASIILAAALQALGSVSHGMNDQHVAVSVRYETPVRPVNSVEDLKTQWIGSLFQKMCDIRLGGDPYYDFLPAPSYDISMNGSEELCMEKLEDLLDEIDEIRRDGFTAKEWDLAKAQSMEFLDTLTDDSHSSAEYAEKFMLSGQNLGANAFASISKELVGGLDLKEVSGQAPFLLAEENRSIELSALPEADQKGPPIQLVNNLVAYGPPEAFQQLPLYDWEKEIIHKIISLMAEKNVLELGLRKRSIEKKGKKINQVHPLRFAGYIFSDPHLKKCMREVRKSHFKWNGYIDGFSRRMKEEAARDNILPYLNGFCQMLNVDVQHVAQLVHKHDWEGIIKLLF